MDSKKSKRSAKRKEAEKNAERKKEVNKEVSESSVQEEKSVEEIVNSFITTKDEQTEAVLQEYTSKAKEIRDAINHTLLKRDTQNVVDDSNDATDNAISLQQKLESDIKTKISDLEAVLSVSESDIQQEPTKEVKTNSEKDNEEAETKMESETTECLNVLESCNAKENKNEIPNDSKKEVNDSLNEKIEEPDLKSQCKKPKTGNKTEKQNKVNLNAITKKLGEYQDDSQKVKFLLSQLEEVMEKSQNSDLLLKQHKKSCLIHQREKEQLQTEYNKNVLLKSRLENVCRELQRQNKQVKEESLSKIKDEEEKRKAIANKFQGTLNDIMQLIQENNQRNLKLKEENADLAQKLKSLMEHYEVWEKHIEKIVKQKDLEIQLVKAKLAKTNLMMNQEKEVFLKEKQQLIMMVSDLQKRSSELATTELHLRSELSLYTTKYEEFQGVLGKSNDMFNKFKSDMEKMSKQIKKLEKETQQWKNKWENSNKALISLSEEVSGSPFFSLQN